MRRLLVLAAVTVAATTSARSRRRSASSLLAPLGGLAGADEGDVHGHGRVETDTYVDQQLRATASLGRATTLELVRPKPTGKRKWAFVQLRSLELQHPDDRRRRLGDAVALRSRTRPRSSRTLDVTPRD